MGRRVGRARPNPLTAEERRHSAIKASLAAVKPAGRSSRKNQKTSTPENILDGSGRLLIDKHDARNSAASGPAAVKVCSACLWADWDGHTLEGLLIPWRKSECRMRGITGNV